ncbi:MAG: AraC family transcriptional regulator [Fimbriimonadales bacterium]
MRRQCEGSPCAYGLAAARVSGVRFRTRSELLPVLLAAKARIEGAEFGKLAKFAKDAGLSQYHFQRLYRRAFGVSPRQAMISKQMERAQAMLRDGTCPVSIVGLECGFGSPSAFSRAFRKHVGVAPADFRKNCQAEQVAAR